MDSNILCETLSKVVTGTYALRGIQSLKSGGYRFRTNGKFGIPFIGKEVLQEDLRGYST